MIDLTPQTVSLVNTATGVIYRFERITVDSEHNCTLTYTPVNPNSNLQDFQLSFDELPEVNDVIRMLAEDPHMVVAAIVVLEEEQEDEGCPVCEELGDEVSPESFEKHCQMYAESIHEMIQDAVDEGRLVEALDVVEKLRNELPDEMNRRIMEIARERAFNALKRAMTSGRL